MAPSSSCTTTIYLNGATVVPLHSFYSNVFQPASTSMSDKEESPSSRQPPAQNLRFVVANDPDQFRDRSTMRSNRSHVMHNHLSEKRASESTSPNRGLGPSRGTARRNASTVRSRTGSPSFQVELPREDLFVVEQGRSPQDSMSVQRRSIDPRSRTSRRPSARSSPSAPSQGRRGSQIFLAQSLPPSESLTSPLDTLFVTPLQGESMLALGSPLSTPQVSVVDSLSQPLSPQGQGILPEVLRDHVLNVLQNAGSAFCLSNYTLDERLLFIGLLSLASPNITFTAPNSPSATASDVISSEAMQVLHYSFGDPHSRISDVTVIAVLYLILQETLLGDIDSAKVHKRGLESILNFRRGVQNLGHTTHTPLMIIPALLAISQEERLQGGCLELWLRQPRFAFRDPLRTPQSPLLFQPATFAHNYSSSQCSRTTYDLLRMSCELTGLVHESMHVQQQLAQNDPNVLIEHDTTQRQQDIAERIYGLNDSINETSALAANDAGDVLQACRIAAMIYSTSVSRRLPFALSVDTLQDSPEQQVSIASLCGLLQRTNLLSCWDNMSGTLLWITLVGAVAARDASDKSWLLAVATRCVLTLSIEHEAVVLETIGSLTKVMELWTEASEAQAVE